MIAKFGSVAEIQRHCGWTGNVETSWKPVSASQSDAGAKSKTLAQIDGLDSILYWVDLTTEMAFYLPHHFTGTTFVSLPFDLRLRLVDPSSNEMKILIVWLEESCDQLDSILDGQTKSREISIIGIHPLKNHLFRISLNSNAQRFDLSSPLSFRSHVDFVLQNANGLCESSAGRRNGFAAAHSSVFPSTSGAQFESTQTFGRQSEVTSRRRSQRLLIPFSFRRVLALKRPTQCGKVPSAKSSANIKIEQKIWTNFFNKSSSRPPRRNNEQMSARQATAVRHVLTR